MTLSIYIYERTVKVFVGRCFATSNVMRSKPGDIFWGKVDIQCYNFDWKKVFGGKDNYSGDYRRH